MDYQSLFTKGAEVYKESKYRTHHDGPGGRVYDLDDIPDIKYVEFASKLPPTYCLSENINKDEIGKAFIDLDRPENCGPEWRIDWDVVTAILLKYKYICIVLLSLYQGSHDLGKAHLVFQNGDQEKVHEHFKEVRGYDPQCKTSLRMPYQFKIEQGSFKQHKAYYVPVWYFKFKWIQLLVEESNVVFRDFQGKPWDPTTVPEESRESFFEASRPIFRKETVPSDLWDLMLIRNGIKKKPKEKPTKKTSAKPVNTDPDPFLIGPHCNMPPFTTAQKIEQEVLSAIEEATEKVGEENMTIDIRDEVLTETMNKHFAILAATRDISIVKRAYCDMDKTTVFSLVNPTSMQCHFSNSHLPIRDKKRVYDEAFKAYIERELTPEEKVKEMKKNNIYKIWFHNKRRRIAHSIRFLPRYTPGLGLPPEMEGTINTYTGLAFTEAEILNAFKDEKARKWADEFQRFLFRRICNSKEHLFAYFMNFINFAIKEPASNCLTFIYIHGPQGTGKSLSIKHIMRIFGVHGIQLQSFEEFCDPNSFNGHLANKVVVSVDEMDVSVKSNLNGLKQVVTNGRKELRQKFKETIQIENHLKIIGTSNKSPQEIIEKINSVEALQRRIVIFTVPSEFNILTDLAKVMEEVLFMTKKECDAKDFQGIRCWYSQFYCETDASNDFFDFFNEDALARWEMGKIIPAEGNITNFHLKSPSETILLQYLWENVESLPMRLRNPLLEPYWGVYNNQDANVPLLMDPVWELRKKMGISTTIVNNKVKLVDHPVWENYLCVDNILSNIVKLIDDKVLHVRNKGDVTVTYLVKCFAELIPDRQPIKISVPHAVVHTMNSVVQFNGPMTTPAPKKAEIKNTKSSIAQKTDYWTFIDVGSKEEFMKRLIQAKKEPTEELKEEAIQRDKMYMNKIYGGSVAIKQTLNFFKSNKEAASPQEVTMSK